MYREYLIAIGEIVLYFKNLEELVMDEILKNSSLDNPINFAPGVIILNELFYSKKLKILDKLLKVKYPNGDFEKFFEKLDNLGKKRNFYAHSVFNGYRELKHENIVEYFVVFNLRNVNNKGEFTLAKLEKKIYLKDLQNLKKEINLAIEEFVERFNR